MSLGKNPQVKADLLEQFPQLQAQVRGKDFVYLDNAATTLVTKSVVETMSEFDLGQVSNVHRGAHYFSDQATTRFENSRKRVAQFIGASSQDEVVYTRGTTEAINLVASGLGQTLLSEGDEVLLSEMEHHSNIVPWQIVAEKVGAQVRFLPITDSGELDLSQLDTYLTSKTKVVSLVYCSNTLGTINDVKALSAAAKSVGAVFVLDAAQAVAAFPCRVQELGCDFFTFSGHKIFGPFGIGVLWGRSECLAELPPYQGGGSMIAQVKKQGTTYLGAPQRFEAGTPNITGAIGLAAALDFVDSNDFPSWLSFEQELLSMADGEIRSIPGLRIWGEAENKTNILSFTIDGTHPSDIGHLLDQQGVAVRTGHHCTQLIMDRYSLPGTVRASFSVYNTEEDVHRFVQALVKAKEMLV